MTNNVSVLLWNVWNLPSWLTDGRSKSRAGQISALLNEYDIVVLNEAFVNIRTLLAQTTHAYRFIPARGCTLFSSGLIFLSRYKIVHSNFQKYDVRQGVDRLTAKGFGHITVNIEDHRVHILGTHMQASHNSAQPARLSQAKQLARYISRLQATQDTTILAGDLNMGPAVGSQHYFDQADAIARTHAYSVLLNGSNLVEARCVDYDYENEICRCLVSDKLAHTVEFVLKGYTDHEERLSDTRALCLRFKLD